ncbi:MAG: sodium-dependent transporter [Deltaproteobacteria bacterium CG11_big_fil_rev_8_21_14_0_20_45_16]|nr:MAG: sodium-dependent transporter [Deltaproteobacteria bacterium CG11_big_fil_rev_8_21_14_0_20_45_16]
MTARAHWTNRLAFILAASGSAVGLGNIWKFPYITGTNGGGAFVLIYLVCIALVGIPIFIAELYIGQSSQKSVVESFEVLDRKNSPWKSIGWLGLAAAFLILSFYSVVGGWVLDFEYRSLIGEFTRETDDQISSTLGNLFGNPGRQLLWHFIFMAMTVSIVLRGVKEGLEKWNKILMPGLILMLVGLLVYSVQLDGFMQSLKYLFSFNTDALTPAGVLEAVGHSFFTLSLGMGAIITYGSYLQKREAIARTAIVVGLVDTAVALAAGVVIFAVVFTFGMEPGAGPSLMFKTLPMLFVKLPVGQIVAIIFFLLVSFAALTSSVSLLEVVVAYWEEKKKISRKVVTIVTGVIIYALGMLSALSTNVLSDFKIMGLTFFDLFDKATSQYFLPIGGLFIAMFFGWKLGPEAAKHALGGNRPGFSAGLMWSARLVAPIAVGIIIIYKIYMDFQ